VKKAILILALTAAGVCLIVSAYFCQFYYSRYRDVTSRLEGSVSYFGERLAILEAHKSRELTPVHVRGWISTADQPAEEHLLGWATVGKHPADFFEATDAKGGPHIRPELRLPIGATTNCQFDIHIHGEFGIVVDAWLSHGEPYVDLAKFEEFRVWCPNGTNIVRLIARPKPGASVKMVFEFVVLCER
jgi:hypothetical protein